jgi:hypothetical protein
MSFIDSDLLYRGDLQQVSDFVRVLRYPPPIELTATM